MAANGDPDSGLFRRSAAAEDSTVECLGMIFESEEARRDYFLARLKEKLPDLRQRPDFPVAEDDDILRMSDPPYYTACPNPFLAEFVERNGRPYDPDEPYHREPFAVDVSAGKTDPLYRAHGYHTKVPHLAIVPSLLHYTQPGDVVLDGFCGSGMTGVAAQWCGAAPPAYRRTLEQLWKAEEREPPAWGARRVVLGDLSPAATFIAANYNIPFDVGAFHAAAGRLLAEVEAELGWMYETRHTDGRRGQINYTVWSEVFSCPDCTGEVVFLDEVLDKASRRTRTTFPCPHCAVKLAKDNLVRSFETLSDPATGEPWKRIRLRPVLFHEPDNDTTVPSKALLSDFLADSLNLLITDEMYVEINRKDNAAQRRLSRQRAQGFPTARHDLKFAGHLTDALSAVLPRNTPSQQSDIQQLAKTAAADVKFFVTRDNGLLKKSGAILDSTGVQVVRPTELIVRLHELSDRQSYVPRRVAGHGLEWRRLTSSDLAAFPLAAFRAGAEREGVLRDRLGTFLAEPAKFSVDVLWLADQAVAIRILTERPGGIVAVPYCRIARAVDSFLFSRFLLADTIASAVAHCGNLVVFENTGAPRDLVPHLLNMNFVDHNGAFLRYCFSLSLDLEEALSKIVALSPGCEEYFRRLSTLELEECCSPCSIEDTDQNHFLVPIRPGYAMSLFDVDRSADDLFGGRTTVLLRWENAYYRARTQHRMLKPPARILWYVSHSVRKVVAVSRLNSVEIGRPKVLLKKFKKFGILEWPDLFEMCQRDPTREIMALVFSHTYSFREPVALTRIILDVVESVAGRALIVERGRSAVAARGRWQCGGAAWRGCGA